MSEPEAPHHHSPEASRPARRRGMSVRLKLTLSYVGFLMLAGALLLTVVWLFLLRYVPERTVSDNKGYAPGRGELIDAFLPRALQILAALLVFGLVGGWILAGRMLAPLNRLTEATRIAGTGNLDHRVQMHGNADEFRELADTFDTMLDRIASHVSEQQRFAANASHELRTPLSTSQAILQVASSDPEREMDTETSRDLARLQAVNSQAIELTQSLLLLSRAGRELTDVSEADLSLLAEQAEETMVPDAEAAKVTVRTNSGALPKAAVVTGSPALLLQLTTNLLQNAIVHNLPQHGQVWVTTFRAHLGAERADRDVVVLRVENTGTPVAPEMLPRLIEPFQRGEGRTQRSPDTSPDSGQAGGHVGAGLGLAIVQRIAETHGGCLHISPRLDGGLRVDAVFPAAQA